MENLEGSETASSQHVVSPSLLHPASVNVLDDPYFVHHSEISSNPVVSKVLVGQENYATWKKSMEIALSGRSKLSFIKGTYPKPSEPIMAARWQRCNDVVMSWLIGSVSDKIVGEILHANDVMTAWEILESSYAGTDLARKSDLQRELENMIQGDLSVMAYKRKLESLWQELDAISTVKCTKVGDCNCCKQTKENKHEDRVIKFLMGLNDCYASVRTHVFALTEVPKFSTVYGLALQEESSRHIRKASSVEASALYGQSSQGNANHAVQGTQANQTYGNQNYNNQMRGRDANRGGFNKSRPRIFCTHCQMSGHLKENCYKLIGYPQNPKVNKSSKVNPNGKSSVNAVTNTVSGELSSDAGEKQQLFTSSQLEQIMAILRGGGLAEKQENTTHMANHVHMAGIAHCKPTLDIPGDWLIDSGATSHFVCDAKLLKDVYELKDEHRVTLPNGDCINIKHSGTCVLGNGLVLSDVLLVPDFEVNLISVSRLASDNKCQVLFTDSNCVIQDQHSRTILETGRPVGGLYSTIVPQREAGREIASNLDVKKTLSEVELRHNRLGHASFDVVYQLLKSQKPCVNWKHVKYHCSVCPLAKQAKLSFPLSTHSTIDIFELLHSDVWGPFHEPTLSGAKYFLTVVDDYSRAVWIFLLQQKSEGCIQQSSCPYTPQQNGLVERKHRHILEVARALMFEAGLPKKFSGDSVLTATHIINRLPSSVLDGKCPWEILFHEKPHVDHLRTFGCSCFVSTNASVRDKFDPRALECILLGYPVGQKGYKLFCLATQEIIISRHVVFREDVFPFKQSAQQLVSTSVKPVSIMAPIEVTTLFGDDDHAIIGTPSATDPSYDGLVPDDSLFFDASSNDQMTEENVDMEFNAPVASVPNLATSGPSLRRSTRPRKPPTWTKDYVCNTVEIKALEDNHTWILTDLPRDKTLVDCKWIYKVKFHSDGSVERYKARLVARGFTQVEGLDFHETFAPVAKMTTVRCLLVIAVARQWPLHQLDVNNAFLHGNLDEEVYMKLPPGFYKKEKVAGKVCRLMKSLYGLKQASRQWFAKFSEALIAFGFQNSFNDYSLFTLSKDGAFLILLVYVDDVILTGTSDQLISEVKLYIHNQFQIKDLGHLKYFLGLEVARSTAGLFLHQRKYALELLEEHNLTDCKPAKTPIELKHKLSLSTEPLLSDPLQYQRLIGKLIYMTITRPDLSYPVHILSQFMQQPTTKHLRAAHRVLRYIKGAPAQGLFFSADSTLQLQAESEYRSMAAVCCEIIWLARLLADMGQSVTTPSPLHCDNKAAIHIAHNPVFHERTKHVEIDCHLIRSQVISKFILPVHISTSEQPADMFTKPLPFDHLHQLCIKEEIAGVVVVILVYLVATPMKTLTRAATELQIMKPTQLDEYMRKELLKNWAMKWGDFTQQPVDDIQSYFGTQIATYLSFLGMFTRWMAFPAAFGLALHLFSFGPLKSLLLPVFFVSITLWAISFCQFWKRKYSALLARWQIEYIARPGPTLNPPGIQDASIPSNTESITNSVTTRKGKEAIQRMESFKFFMRFRNDPMTIFSIICLQLPFELAYAHLYEVIESGIIR
ncbi:unnamed protein product [Rhodiola kirilowii]